MTVVGLALAGVLFGFAAFLIATGLFYGLPLPVQPMKAVSAVVLVMLQAYVFPGMIVQ